jgi:hypothetical protein
MATMELPSGGAKVRAARAPLRDAPKNVRVLAS